MKFLFLLFVFGTVDYFKIFFKKNLRIAKKLPRNREDQLRGNKSNGKNTTNLANHTKLLKLKHNKIYLSLH